MNIKTIIKLTALILLMGCGSSNGESSSFRIQPPVIESENIYFVEENTREAFQIKAIDNGSLKYYLSGGDSNLLYVDLLSGEVFFNEPTDFETKSTYNFTIIIEDSVGNRTAKDITIKVKDNPNETIIIATEHNNSLPQNSEYFITTWQTDKPGLSDNNQIIIQTIGDGYNYNIDWGDNTSSKNLTQDTKHSYNSAGVYTIRITGKFPRIFFKQNIKAKYKSDNQKLLSVEQWGDNQWSSMAYAFAGCTNMVINSVDIPDLSKVTDMHYMFYMAYNFTQDISFWDVSNIKNTSNMFYMAYYFNHDLSSWNVSNVTNMNSMFEEAHQFTSQNLSEWNVSKVIHHQGFFKNSGKNNIEPKWKEKNSNLTLAIQKAWLKEKGISLKITTNDILFINATTRLVKVSNISMDEYTNEALNFIEYAIFNISKINNPKLLTTIRFEDYDGRNIPIPPSIKLLKNGIARFDTRHNVYIYDLNTNKILLDFLRLGEQYLSFIESKDNRKIYILRHESMESPILYEFNLDTSILRASEFMYDYYIPPKPRLSDDETKIIMATISDDVELNINNLLTHDEQPRYSYPK